MKTLFLVFYGFQEYNGISKNQIPGGRPQAMRGRCTHLPLRGWQRRQPEVDDRRRCAC